MEAPTKKWSLMLIEKFICMLYTMSYFQTINLFKRIFNHTIQINLFLIHNCLHSICFDLLLCHRKHILYWVQIWGINWWKNICYAKFINPLSDLQAFMNGKIIKIDTQIIKEISCPQFIKIHFELLLIYWVIKEHY